jgi:hypothetical protein
MENEWEIYATSLQNRFFKNELDVEIKNTEPGNIFSRFFFSDLYGQNLNSIPTTLANL